jgi:DNA-binding CsgD family transcriptional regulator
VKQAKAAKIVAPTARSSPLAAEDELRRFAKRLFASAELRDRPLGFSPDEELVLDVEVDGFRCVLVCSPQRPDREHALLSPREREIARMVAQGYPNKTIAAVLDISSWTVSTHLRRIFAKLSVRSRAAMVARILEDGLFDERPHVS